MNITLSAPSKTFFLGEYLALAGAPALIINTEPRFKLHVIYNNCDQQTICRGINPHSPAGKFLNKHPELTKKFGFEFRDPHVGHGGFGASSAQFLLFYIFNLWLENHYDWQKYWDMQTFLDEYINCSWDGIGFAPSGADLIAQMHGGITYFDKSNKIIEILPWQLADHKFMLIHTGNKVATHQHLRNYKQIATEELEPFVVAAKKALENSTIDDLINSINQFSQALIAANLVSQATQLLLEKIKTEANILTAKGCGALGADVILMIFHKDQEEPLINWCQKQQLAIIATSAQMSNGVEIQHR